MIVATTLIDGPRHAVLHFALSTNEEVGSVLIDPATLTPPSSKLTVEEILFDFAGLDAQLSFNSDVVEGILTWVLPEGGANYIDFRSFGGFKDRSGINGDGVLRLTTFGLDDGDIGTMIVKVRKD